MRGWWKASAGVAAVALAVSGCAGGGGSDRTLTVWLMHGSAAPAVTDELHQEFQRSHPGVTVKYEVQQWNGIQERLTTALSGPDTPDVIEIGNTQTPKFAAANVLTDLTGGFDQAQWLPSLTRSGAWQGKQYAVPFYAANRLVLYRTDMFQQAGITAPPTSRQEWLTAIERLRATFGSDPDFQAVYLPGQNWYTLLSFVYDEGGDIADEKFTATLDSPQTKAGLEFYKRLVDASGTRAPKDADEQTPEQAGIYAQGKVAMMVALPWELDTAAKANPDIKAKSSAFPIPSKDAGKAAPVFQGGSTLAVPAGSAHKDLATDYLKLISGPKYQGRFASAGVIPGTSTDVGALAGNPVTAAMATAAANGRAVPATPRWAQVEAGQNPIKDMLTAYLTGAKSLDQATGDADAALTRTLSG